MLNGYQIKFEKRIFCYLLYWRKVTVNFSPYNFYFDDVVVCVFVHKEFTSDII